MGKNEQNTQQKLVPDHYLILLLTRNIVNERRLSKIPQKCNFIFVFKPNNFSRIMMKNEGCLELVTSLFSGCQISSEASFF